MHYLEGSLEDLPRETFFAQPALSCIHDEFTKILCLLNFYPKPFLSEKDSELLQLNLTSNVLPNTAMTASGESFGN